MLIELLFYDGFPTLLATSLQQLRFLPFHIHAKKKFGKKKV